MPLHAFGGYQGRGKARACKIEGVNPTAKGTVALAEGVQ